MKNKTIYTLILLTLISVSLWASADLSTLSIGTLLNLTSKEKEIVMNYHGKLDAIPYWSVTKEAWIIKIYDSGQYLTYKILDTRKYSITATQEQLNTAMDTAVSEYINMKKQKYPTLNYTIPKMQGRTYT